MSSDSVAILLPELIVVLTATLIYVAGAFLPGKKFWGTVALLGVVAAGFVLAGQQSRWFVDADGHTSLVAHVSGPHAAEHFGPLAVDQFGRFIRWLAIVVGGIFVLTASRPQNESLIPEYVGTVLMAIAGLMLVGSARDLTLLFLGLELISIPTYVLLYLGRRDAAGAEAAAKYFFLSILSSAVTLYGFSYLYGVGGSTRLDEVQAALQTALAGHSSSPLFAQLALVLVFAGLGFKIAAVPFHFYAPDVYQGTTHANAGLLAVLPKIAGITALIRVASVALPGTHETGLRVAMILALLTMTLGNIVALWQDNLRRMLAYSSIAHAGYMLVGLAVDFGKNGNSRFDEIDGVGATLFYVAVYALATAGTFAAFTYLSGRDKQLDTFDDLAGIARSYPGTALAIAVFMFSLTGLPPLAGFWGKFSLFSALVKLGLAGTEGPDGVKLSQWFILLAVVGVLNAAVSAAYYLRVIGVMYFRDPLMPVRAEGGRGAKFAMLACAAMVLGVGFGPSALSQRSNDAAQSARPTTIALPHAATHGVVPKVPSMNLQVADDRH